MALFVPVVIGRSNCFGFGFGFSSFEDRSINDIITVCASLVNQLNP